MATQYQNLSEYDADKLPDALTLSKQQYAIAVADWNPQITHELLKGAFDTLVAHGVKPGNINVVHVPGTFELTFAAKEFSDDYLCEIDNRKTAVVQERNESVATEIMVVLDFQPVRVGALRIHDFPARGCQIRQADNNHSARAKYLRGFV